MRPELRHVYQVYIRTTPEKLWEAITSADLTKLYFYGTIVKSSFKPGDPIAYTSEGKLMLAGEIIEADPPRKLTHTFKHYWSGDGDDDRPSRVTYEVEEVGEVCKLTLIHDDFDSETYTYRSVREGWNPVLSALKTLLETGKPLDIRSPEAVRLT
jgi:uncharacterized protein YndB with AHSA1/START domain